MKPTINLPAEHYLEKIRNKEPFSLARFGDGECIAMQFAPHPLRENCDGSKFLPQLIEPMRKVFRNNYPYYHCALDCTFNEHGNHFKKFLEETCPDMQFYNGEWLQHLSFDGRIRELIDAINPYNPCFIGGSHIAKVKFMIGLENMRFIEAPSKDSFLAIDKLYVECMNMHLAGCRMFLFSCGYTTKILIDRLWEIIGKDSWLIDTGSMWDCYTGKLSRDGMKYYGFSKFQPYTDLLLR